MISSLFLLHQEYIEVIQISCLYDNKYLDICKPTNSLVIIFSSFQCRHVVLCMNPILESCCMMMIHCITQTCLHTSLILHHFNLRHYVFFIHFATIYIIIT